MPTRKSKRVPRSREEKETPGPGGRTGDPADAKVEGDISSCETVEDTSRDSLGRRRRGQRRGRANRAVKEKKEHR